MGEKGHSKIVARGDFFMGFVDQYNAFVGGAVVVLSAVFGQFWYIFALYFLFNILDWLTGWYKSRKLQKESSQVGLAGAIKKLGYWVIVLIGFAIPVALTNLLETIGIDGSFLHLIGWFVLASLMVNEARSILENLVECGYKVPGVLIKGLAVTEKLIQAGAESQLPGDE